MKSQREKSVGAILKAPTGPETPLRQKYLSSQASPEAEIVTCFLGKGFPSPDPQIMWNAHVFHGALLSGPDVRIQDIDHLQIHYNCGRGHLVFL